MFYSCFLVGMEIFGHHLSTELLAVAEYFFIFLK
jgi:hypothetical protein